VPRDGAPPMSALGFTPSANSGDGPGRPGSTSSVAVWIMPMLLYVAWIMIQCGRATGPSVIGKLAPRLPAGTFTLPGTTTVPSKLPFRRTSAPPAGAGEVSRTLPVAVVPPSATAGFNVSAESDGAGAGLAGGVSRSQHSGDV